MSSRWHVMGDFKDVITGTIPPHKVPRPKGWELVVFIGGKVISFSMAFIIPMFFHSWWVVLLFYFLVTGVLGVVLSLVFQLRTALKRPTSLCRRKARCGWNKPGPSIRWKRR